MNSDEVWDLLEIIASVDRRKLGLTDRQTWQALIGDLSFADARAAVADYYRESREWIMPADVRTRVKAMRRERLAREIVPAPPPEDADNPVRFRETLKAELRAIADGRAIPKAITTPVREDDPPPTWAEARAALPIPHVPTPQDKALQQAAESRAAREAADEDPAA